MWDKYKRIPRWGVNAVLYSALGVSCLMVIQMFGPFGNVVDVADTFDNPTTIEVHINGLNMAEAPVKSPYPLVYLKVPSVANSEISNSTLNIMITSSENRGFKYGHISFSRHISRSEFPYNIEEPLDCEVTQYKWEEGKWGYVETDVAAAPAEQDFSIFQMSADQVPDRGMVTRVTGHEEYAYLSIICPLKDVSYRRIDRAAMGVLIPNVLVYTENPKGSTAATVYVDRKIGDTLISSSRPPSFTTLDSYIWETDGRRVGTQDMVVALSDTKLQESSDREMFLWGLFAGIAGAFFVAVVQEVVGRRRQLTTSGA